MKKFKFFEKETETRNYRPLRQYVGFKPMGEINWVYHPVVKVYYLEPLIGADPITEDSVPQVHLIMNDEILTLESLWVNSLNEFLEDNPSKHILIQNLMYTNDNVYDSNSDHIPLDVPLFIRVKTIDPYV